MKTKTKLLLRCVTFFMLAEYSLTVHAAVLTPSVTVTPAVGRGDTDMRIQMQNAYTNQIYFNLTGTGTVHWNHPDGSSGYPVYNQGSYTSGNQLWNAGATWTVYDQSLSLNNYWTSYDFSGTIKCATTLADLSTAIPVAVTAHYNAPNQVAGQNSGFTGAWFISENPLTIYSNIWLTAKNNYNVTAHVFFKWDGVAYVDTYVSAGQTASVQSPAFEIAPIPETYTWSVNIVPNNIELGPTNGGGIGGAPPTSTGATGGGTGANPTPPATTGGGGTAGTGGGGGLTGGGGISGGTIINTNMGGTNGYTIGSGTNKPITVNTNGIMFGTPTGLASESTLQAGIALAHQDALNNLAAVLQGNAAINGLTNLGGGSNSSLTLGEYTNSALQSATVASNQYSGFNALFQSGTNGIGSQYNPLAVAAAGLPYISPEEDSAPPLSEMDIPLGASGIVLPLGANMPVEYSAVRPVFAYAILLMGFLFNWRVCYVAMNAVYSANQTRTAGTEVLGNNVNMGSAMLMAVAITAFIATIPAATIALVSGDLALILGHGNPLPVLQSTGTWGYNFVNHYFPMVTLVSTIISSAFFKVLVPSLASVVMNIKLFLVGL